MTSNNWSTIGEVADVYDGPHATPKKIEQGPIFLGIASLTQGALDLSRSAHISEEDFIKWTRRVTPDEGDVVFSYETRLGEAAIIPPGIKCCLGRRMGLLRPKRDKVIPEFLLYAYLSPTFQELVKARTIHGSTVDRIPLKDLPNFPIQILPLEEQKAIVEVLKKLDGKIEINRQINQTLEQIAQAIFKSWFVDFEPVKAKIEAKQNGQDPERAAMCAISGKADADLDQLPADQLAQLAASAALFPAELVDSELGLIPKGWDVKKIIEWGAVVCGKTPPKKKPSNYGGSIPFIKIPDMHGNVFVIKTNDTLSQKGASTQPKKQVPEGSVCVSCIATVGQVVLTSENSYTNQQINSIIPGKITHNYYLYYCMEERTLLLHELASGGSATLNLNTSNFSKIALVFPGDELLDKFYQNVNAIFESILMNDRETQSLSSIRDTLLPKLLSGEIDLFENTPSA